jgi:dihydroorotase
MGIGFSTINRQQDMQNYLIKNVQVVNEGRIITSDVLIKNGRIEKIGELITQADSSVKEINGEGK